MSYIENIVRNFAQDITRNRKYTYSHDSLSEYLLQHPETGCSTFKVENSRHQNLQTLLLKTNKPKMCIVYAHGLGSNKLQVLNMASYYLKHGFDICSFDFSSSGRSDGNYTSYGLLEQQDIHSILEYLDKNYLYNKYVLWGRSMGSVSIILSQGYKFNQKVQSVILDSPFSSFEKIAIEIASKKSFIPQFMIGLLIQPLKQYFLNNHPINPFQLDIIERIRKIQCKMLIIYSKKDSIINYKHSLELISHCKKIPVEVQIKEDHNMQRSKETYQRILRFMHDCSYEAEKRACSRTKNRGISVTSKQKNMKKQTQFKSNIKIKISHSKNKKPLQDLEQNSNHFKSFKTVSSINQSSVQYSKRHDTEISPSKRRKVNLITSLYNQNKLTLQNKQNIKPSLNVMRKNRFR